MSRLLTTVSRERILVFKDVITPARLIESVDSFPALILITLANASESFNSLLALLLTTLFRLETLCAVDVITVDRLIESFDSLPALFLITTAKLIESADSF